MTILDRTRSSNRVRIDLGQFADELAKHVPDLDKVDVSSVDLGRIDLGKARQSAEKAIEKAVHDATDRARTLRADIAASADKVQADNPLDELGQRIRAVATTTGIRAVIARLERELPDTDKDRYARAYARGRTQARSKYLVVGIAAGVTTGVVAAILLDPKHGKERREAIGRKVGSLTSGLSSTVAGKAKFASDRARGIAIERGLVASPEPVLKTPVPSDIATPVAAPAWPADEGPVEKPLADPAFGAHEALPEELVSATSTSDPTEPAVRD